MPEILNSVFSGLLEIVGPRFSGGVKQHWASVIEQAAAAGIDVREMCWWLDKTEEDAVMPQEMIAALRTAYWQLAAKQGVLTQSIVLEQYYAAQKAGEEMEFPYWAFPDLKRSEEIATLYKKVLRIILGIQPTELRNRLKDEIKKPREQPKNKQLVTVYLAQFTPAEQKAIRAKAIQEK